MMTQYVTGLILIMMMISDVTYSYQRSIAFRSSLSMKWLESTCELSIPASKQKAYDLYSQLDQHHTWSPWLDSVQYLDKSRTLWTLKSLGLTFRWQANNTIEESPNLIQWQSLDGLSNRGRVEFIELKPEITKMILSISYDLPDVAVKVIEGLGDNFKNVVENTLLNDLKRFRSRLLKEIREERAKKSIRR